MFGINCAPEIFQKIMEQILNGCNGCFVYIDDIIIFGSTKEIHDEHLKKVLHRLKEFNVALNKEKCSFALSEIRFLGHNLSAAGIKPTNDKIIAIKQFREPNTAEEVRSFLGLVNFVGKFIPNLATVTEPLRKLTRQSNTFEWTEIQQKAFDQLKNHLSCESTLGYYDVNDRTQIIADASPVGLGAILIQFKESEPRIISYASRSLTQTEQKYAQTEKEALALVWSVERFHFYVFGREFELISDHKPLEVIFGAKSKPCARIERWVLRLQSYKYKVIYKPGKTNIADPLSRLVKWSNVQSDNSDTYVNWIISHAEPKAIKIEEISEESAKDETIQAVRNGIYENNWTDLATPFKIFETELCFADDILLRGTRIVLPKSLYEKAMQLGHEGHPGMSNMKARLRSKIWWPKMDQHIEQFVKQCKGCTLVSAPAPPEPMKRTELPSHPWQHIAIDFLGPLPSGHNLFVIVDYYSRFIEVEIMTKIDSAKAIAKLKNIFARFGFPISITADNGRQFISEEFKQYCETNNIKLNNTIPYWPQQNGEVERQNRSILKRLKISQEQKRDWTDDLNQYLLMYRSTPHSTTSKTPAELMFNWNIRDKLPSIQQHSIDIDQALHDRDKEKKEKGKVYGDNRRNAKVSDIEVGDSVLLKRQVISNKLATTFEPTTFKVIERNGSEITVENIETGTTYKRNVAHVKKISVEETDTNTPIDELNLNEQNSNNNSSSDSPAINENSTESNTSSTHPSTKRKAATSEEIDEDHNETNTPVSNLPAKRKTTRPSRFIDYSMK